MSDLTDREVIQWVAAAGIGDPFPNDVSLKRIVDVIGGYRLSTDPPAPAIGSMMDDRAANQLQHIARLICRRHAWPT